MAKRKKKNNIVQHRDWFYCRLRWYVAMEIGHKNVTTTQLYLRFQADEIKDHFPSLAPIIENMQKNSIRATKTRATIYSNVINLSHSHRE